MMSQNKTSAPTVQTIPRMAGLNTPEAAAQLPQLLHERYPWFHKTNRDDALTYLGGWQLAHERGLARQAQHYQAQIVEIVSRDQAAKAASLVARRLHHTLALDRETYPDARYHPLYRHPQPLPQTAFQGPSRTFTRSQAGYREVVEQGWRFIPLDAYPEMIPPNCLAALTVLEDAGLLTPEALWVAEKTERVTVAQRLPPPRPVPLDPLLGASWGQFIAFLARWE